MLCLRDGRSCPHLAARALPAHLLLWWSRCGLLGVCNVVLPSISDPFSEAAQPGGQVVEGGAGGKWGGGGKRQVGGGEGEPQLGCAENLGGRLEGGVVSRNETKLSIVWRAAAADGFCDITGDWKPRGQESALGSQPCP